MTNQSLVAQPVSGQPLTKAWFTWTSMFVVYIKVGLHLVYSYQSSVCINQHLHGLYKDWFTATRDRFASTEVCINQSLVCSNRSQVSLNTSSVLSLRLGVQPSCLTGFSCLIVCRFHSSSSSYISNKLCTPGIHITHGQTVPSRRDWFYLPPKLLHPGRAAPDGQFSPS